VNTDLCGLFLALGVALRPERAIARGGDGGGFSKEIATAPMTESGLTTLAKGTWERPGRVGYWPLTTRSPALEGGGLEDVLGRAASCGRRQPGGLGADSPILANAHLLHFTH